jgi:S1-C subfamily serine protease
VSGGVLVSSVAEDSTAARAGIQTGDVIIGTDKLESMTATLLLTTLSKQQEDLSLKIMRNGQTILVTLKKQQQ